MADAGEREVVVERGGGPDLTLFPTPVHGRVTLPTRGMTRTQATDVMDCGDLRVQLGRGNRRFDLSWPRRRASRDVWGRGDHHSSEKVPITEGFFLRLGHGIPENLGGASLPGLREITVLHRYQLFSVAPTKGHSAPALLRSALSCAKA